MNTLFNTFYNKLTNIKSYYIFCIWIWLATFLYFFDLIPYSILYLAFGALIFSTYIHFFYEKNTYSLLHRFSIIIFETFILGINIYKHFYIDKLELIVYKDIIFSIVLFLIYLIFLRLNGKTFYQYYFVELFQK